MVAGPSLDVVTGPDIPFDPAEEAVLDPRLRRGGTPPRRVVKVRLPGYRHPAWLLTVDGTVPPQPNLVPLGDVVRAWPELGPVFASGDGDWIHDPTRGGYRTDSLEHQRELAAAALAEAAGIVLQYPRDPQAAEAEAQFESVLEAVIKLHWSGDGRFDGIAHPGIKRIQGRVHLVGAARVREAADRPLRVEISPVGGGTVMLDRPEPRRRGLRRRGGQPVQQGTQFIQIPAPLRALG